MNNIPIVFDAVDDDYDDDLKDFLQNNSSSNDGEPIQVQEINLCYNLSDIEKIDQKI